MIFLMTVAAPLVIVSPNVPLPRTFEMPAHTRCYGAAAKWFLPHSFLRREHHPKRNCDALLLVQGPNLFQGVWRKLTRVPTLPQFVTATPRYSPRACSAASYGTNCELCHLEPEKARSLGHPRAWLCVTACAYTCTFPPRRVVWLLFPQPPCRRRVSPVVRAASARVRLPKRGLAIGRHQAARVLRALELVCRRKSLVHRQGVSLAHMRLSGSAAFRDHRLSGARRNHRARKEV